jgi:DNA-binding NarL/FixJ family response regulator
MLSILIVDDHPVVREGLRHILTEEFEGVVIAEARSHLSLPMV